jgi:hypothetical protein
MVAAVAKQTPANNSTAINTERKVMGPVDQRRLSAGEDPPQNWLRTAPGPAGPPGAVSR